MKIDIGVKEMREQRQRNLTLVAKIPYSELNKYKCSDFLVEFEGFEFELDCDRRVVNIYRVNEFWNQRFDNGMQKYLEV